IALTWRIDRLLIDQQGIDHPTHLEACNGTGRRAAEIVVDDFDLAPAKLAEPVPHGVLQDPALLIVHDLMRRGLPNVEDGLATEITRFDLVTHRRAPCRLLVGPHVLALVQPARHPARR